MDSDARAPSGMFATSLQNPLQKQQSYLVDEDSTSNGRSKPTRARVNRRTRSATNPEPATPQSTASPPTTAPASSATSTLASGSPVLTRTASYPTTSTTPTTASAAKPQSKPRRGLFSLLASAAQPPTPPKPDPSATAAASTSSPVKDAPASNSTAADPPQPPPAPSFMQSIARRLSGSNSRNKPTEHKNQVPQCPRRTLNVNHARPRPEIKELEKIQLKRVCFVVDETLVSRRLFKASEPFETELPRENKLKVRDLKEAYYRSSKNREITPDDRIANAFSTGANGVELATLDLSSIKFGSKEAVLPVCDVLSLAKGLEEVVLDDCELTDEQLRLFLSALLSLRPRPETDQDWHRGISKLSIAGNTTFGMNGWRSLAYFVHLNADLVSLNISRISIPLEAAQLLSRAIALPNPPRREIPPEFRLLPISPKPRSRKFSFRRASATGFGTEIARVKSPNQPKHIHQSNLSEEIEVIEKKPDGKTEAEGKTESQETAAPATPAMHSSESSSIVVVDPPTSERKHSVDSRSPFPTCLKVSELRMNQCEVTADVLKMFIPAVREGGVRYWDIGNNKFGVDGMKLLATLFTDIKREGLRSELAVPEIGHSSPTPTSSIASAKVSTTSLAVEEKPTNPSSTQGHLEFLSLKGTDLSSGQLEPLLEVWLNESNPECLSLWALELSNCRLGRDLTFLANLFKALTQFPNFKVFHLQQNPLFANPGFIKALGDWLPRLSILKRINLASTGMTAQDLVELSRILPKAKTLATLDIHDNPIYEINYDEEEREGQTEDVSGLTALDASMRYCRQMIEVELPEGGGVEAARLRQRIFLRCFKNIEFLDHAVHPYASEDPAEYTLAGRKRTTTEEAKELALQPPTSRESRDKYEVDRGHGVARALETVLQNASSEDKAQDMSLDLLHRARKIKERLQPALVRGNQDKPTLRRLTFLNQVLTKVIDRFEEAFPECSSAPPKPRPSHEPDSSEDESEEDEGGSPPSPARLRRSSSMSEIARGLELEEGDVHRFNQFVKKRGLHKVETLADLSSEQLLEAILSVDKETVEREVWDKAGLQKVLRRSIDEGSKEPSNSSDVKEGETLEETKLSWMNKKDSDSHSI